MAGKRGKRVPSVLELLIPRFLNAFFLTLENFLPIKDFIREFICLKLVVVSVIYVKCKKFSKVNTGIKKNVKINHH